MNHKYKFLFLVLLLMSLVSIFVWDRNNVNKNIEQVQKKIHTVEKQLGDGTGIMAEIDKIQQFFIEKKNISITNPLLVFVKSIKFGGMPTEKRSTPTPTLLAAQK